jgi:hypothetical protein
MDVIEIAVFIAGAPVDLRRLYVEIRLCPGREFGRLQAGYFVCQRNLIGRIRTQVSMRFPVTEHLGNFGCPRKGTREILLWDLLVGKVVPLSIQGLNDFVKA